MEAGGLDVGRIFARLDAKMDDRAFRRFDAAVDRSKGKARDLGREQDRLSRSTSGLTRAQQRQVQALRSQGDGWGSIARKVGVSGRALREYNEISRTTVREQEKVRRSTKDTERQFVGLDGAVARINRTTTLFSRTLRLLKWPAIIAGAGAALQAVNSLSAGVVGLVSALGPLSGLLVVLPAALGTFGQGLGTALLGLAGVKDAVKALNDEQSKGAATAEDSARRQRSAAEQIRAAEEQLGDAQRGERSAQDDLTDARREAVQTLQDMRTAAIEARLGEQGAQMSLRRAISDLRKAEMDPKASLLDLEELELRVHESRQQLDAARQESRRAQQENRQAQRGGIRGDPGVVSARQQLADADRDVARAKRGVIEAERDARESLAETDAAANKVRESFSELSPEAARFSRFLFGLKPQLEGLQATASKGFLPGAEKGIRSALQNLPVVNRIIGGTSRVMGNLSERAGRLFGSRGFGRDIETVGRGNARTLGLMGRSAEHFSKALTNVMVVAQPLLRWLGKSVNHFSAWIEKSTEVNRSNGDMARFFGRTRQVVEVLVSIFQSLGATMGVIGEEAAPLGRQILKAFDEGAEGLERWAESTRGRNSISEYFENARGPLWEFGRLVRDVVKAFFELGDAEGSEGLTRLIHQLRVELLPVVTEVLKSTSETFGPHLVSLLTTVLGLFARLAGSTGPLTLYVDSLTAGAKAMSFMLDNVPGLRELIGLVTVLKTIKWVGAFTGLGRGLEMAFGDDVGERLKGRLRKIVGAAFSRGRAALGFVYSWGAEVAGQAAAGIGRQVGRFRAVARRAAIAFIGVFAPQVAAGMAAGGKLGEVLATRFPKLAGMFKNGGKMAGRGFVIGVVLGVVLLGAWLGKKLTDSLSESTKEGMRDWGINAGQNFVNALVWAVNKGIEAINKAMDEANVFGKLGVDAPNIGRVGEVDFKTGAAEDADARRRQRRRTRKDLRRRGVNPDDAGLDIIDPGEAGAVPEGVVPGRWRDRQERRRREREERRRDREEREREEMMLGSAGRRRPRGRSPEDEAKRQGKAVTDEHRKMRRNVEDETTRMQRTNEDRFQRMRRSGDDQTRRMSRSVGDSVGSMRRSHDGATKRMLSDTDTRFTGMREVVRERSSRMAETLDSNVGEMDDTTRRGMEQIEASVVKALKAFGIKKIDLDVTGGDRGDRGKANRRAPAKAARGGVFTVPGEGLQDSVYLPGVNAMVAPGEDLFAATRHQQPLLDFAVSLAFPGVGGLDDFFATFDRPHYLAQGGRATVGGKAPSYTGPNAGGLTQGILTLAGWLQHLHGMTISSGVRPTDSDSEHSLGIAADFVGGDWAGSAGYLNKFRQVLNQGIYNPAVFGGSSVSIDSGSRVPTSFWGSETWEGHKDHQHASVPGAGRALGASGPRSRGRGAPQIKTPLVGGARGTYQAIAQAALERTTRGANAYLQRRTGAGGMAAASLEGYVAPPPGILSEEQFLEIARLALKLTGHGNIRGGARKLLVLAKQESSLNTRSINNWDVNAAAGNPSGGLMHTTETTFRAYHEPGTANTYYDPLASIASSINYQFATYDGLVTHSPYARGGRIRRLAKGGKATGPAIAGRRATNARKPRRRSELAENKFGGRPTGKYSPAVLLQLVAETGIGLPYTLLKDGVPNWRELPVATYAKLVNEYLQQVSEYRSNLAEERTSAEESSPPTPLQPSITALSPNTIAEAIGFHLPAGGEAGAYTTAYSALGALDRAGEVLRGAYLNTFTEGYLAPYERRKTEITHSRDAVLASLDPEREQREFARAKLQGLRKRRKQQREQQRRQRNKEAKANSKKSRRRARGGRLLARGGRAFLAKGGKGKPAVGAAAPAKAVRTPKQQARRARQTITRHGKAVKRRAANKQQFAEELYEEEMEGVLDPAEREREELEWRMQYEQSRREELAPLLTEIALNVQRTALVGRIQDRMLSTPSFERGGHVPASARKALGSVTHVNPQVKVPLAVHLSGAMEALNPHIQAVVDGRLRDMGHAAGTSRSTVSAPGRRVSYRGA